MVRCGDPESAIFGHFLTNNDFAAGLWAMGKTLEIEEIPSLMGSLDTLDMDLSPALMISHVTLILAATNDSSACV